MGGREPDPVTVNSVALECLGYPSLEVPESFLTLKVKALVEGTDWVRALSSDMLRTVEDPAVLREEGIPADSTKRTSQEGLLPLSQEAGVCSARWNRGLVGPLVRRFTLH